jgi:hypothetical protein
MDTSAYRGTEGSGEEPTLSLDSLMVTGQLHQHSLVSAGAYVRCMSLRQRVPLLVARGQAGLPGCLLSLVPELIP